MKFVRIISNSLFCIIIVSLLLIICFSFNDKNIPRIGNHSLLVVRGKSMNPELKNGYLIAVNREIKDRYEVGNVISFVDSNSKAIITHEIVEVAEVNDEIRYLTKGINNTNIDDDYVVNKQIIGEYEGFKIPLLGYVTIFASTNVGYLLLVVLPLGIVFVLLMIELIKEVNKKKGEV